MISIIQVCKNKEALYQKNLEMYDDIVEVLRPCGQNPSQLRNKAAQSASGEILLFLDDDSYIGESTLKRYVKTFTDHNIDILGGPALLRSCDKDTYSEIVSKLLSSSYVIGPHANRYRANGSFRESNEKELILCNLAIRKETFLKHQGFLDELYPWEENEFLNKVSRRGVKPYYDPQLITTREMTSSVLKLFYKVFSYGHGRGKMAGIDSPLYVLPLIIFFLTLYAATTLRPVTFLSLYFVYLGVVGVIMTIKTKKLKTILIAPLLTWGIHFSYGQGLMTGLILFFFRKCFGHFLNSGNRINMLK